MKLLRTIALALSVAVPVVSAAPSAEDVAEPAALVSRANHPKFYLKSEVKSGQPGKDHFNGLWLGTYHTGAGLNDVVLWGKKKNGVPVFQNGTHAQFAIPGDIPYGMKLSFDGLYNHWSRVTANAGYGGQAKFVVKKGQLVVVKSKNFDEWGSWRVCDFWLGVPQLFWDVSYFKAEDVAGCAKINLVKVPV